MRTFPSSMVEDGQAKAASKRVLDVRVLLHEPGRGVPVPAAATVPRALRRGTPDDRFGAAARMRASAREATR